MAIDLVIDVAWTEDLKGDTTSCKVVTGNPGSAIVIDLNDRINGGEPFEGALEALIALYLWAKRRGD